MLDAITIAEDDMAELAALKYGDLASGGWAPRLRRRFGYYTPDDWYEAAVFRLVDAGTEWLDVGCGRAIFPSNLPAARVLANRCRSLTGLDPSDNIDENPLVHHRAKCTLEAFDTGQRFDLITLRMVVEHITDPPAAVRALARLARPGARIIVYTVNKWSPVSLVSAITPMIVHHRAKSWLWQAEERDTFPTAYRMNTRSRLKKLFARAGLEEEFFRVLADTRSTGRSRMLNTLELLAWRACNTIGLTYPENCLLGIYRRLPE